MEPCEEEEERGRQKSKTDQRKLGGTVSTAQKKVQSAVVDRNLILRRNDLKRQRNGMGVQQKERVKGGSSRASPRNLSFAESCSGPRSIKASPGKKSWGRKAHGRWAERGEMRDRTAGQGRKRFRDANRSHMGGSAGRNLLKGALKGEKKPARREHSPIS